MASLYKILVKIIANRLKKVMVVGHIVKGKTSFGGMEGALCGEEKERRCGKQHLYASFG